MNGIMGMMEQAGMQGGMMNQPAQGRLLKTDKQGTGRGSHSHFIYMGVNGVCQCSEDMKHMHPVLMGENGLEIMEANDHKHTASDFVPVKKDKPKKSEDLVAEVISLRKSAKEFDIKSRREGEDAEKAYEGDQWDEGDKAKLKSEDRACLTINEIESKIDLLSGYQRQNRSDIRYFPVEEGDARMADILNIVSKSILEQNGFDSDESEVFEDEAIVGRGLINHFINYDENIEGEIVVEKYPWRDAWFGPHEKRDFSDGEFLVKEKPFSKAKVKQMWPDKADDIDEMFEAYQKEGGTSHKIVGADQYKDESNSEDVDVSKDLAELIDIARKEIKVCECERKEYENVPVLVNQADNFVFNGEGMDSKETTSIKTLDGFNIVYRKTFKIRVTAIAGSVLLSDDYKTDFNDFSLIPIYAKKRGKKWWGKVKAAIDPNKEINKRHSQSIDIINRVAAYGWFYDATTFPDEAKKKEFRKNSAKPGFTQELTDVTRPPAKVEGSKFPAEIVQLEELSSQKLREIMNINLDMQGLKSNLESGVAIIEHKRQGLIGNDYLYDSLSIGKKKLAKNLVKMIQATYKPERIMRIVLNQNQKAPVEIGGMKLVKDPAQAMNEQGEQVGITEQDVLQLLQNADLAKYDVAVGEAAYNPTTKHANFVIWAQMAQTGVPVPPALLVDLSDLPDKDKVKKGMQEMMASQQQEADKNRQVELIKAGKIPMGMQGVGGMGGPGEGMAM